MVRIRQVRNGDNTPSGSRFWSPEDWAQWLCIGLDDPKAIAEIGSSLWWGTPIEAKSLTSIVTRELTRLGIEFD